MLRCLKGSRNFADLCRIFRKYFSTCRMQRLKILSFCFWIAGVHRNCISDVAIK